DGGAMSPRRFVTTSGTPQCTRQSLSTACGRELEHRAARLWARLLHVTRVLPSPSRRASCRHMPRCRSRAEVCALASSCRGRPPRRGAGSLAWVGVYRLDAVFDLTRAWLERG